MSRTLRLVWQDRRARVGLALVVLFAVLATFASVVASHDPTAQLDLVGKQYQPPSLAHPFGTDFYSRDLLSRVLHGARISLSIAVLSVAVSIVLGTAVGLAAGLAGGLLDQVLMRGVDGALAMPRLFLVLVVVALWEDVGVVGLVLILGLTSWFDTSRIVRAEVLSVKSRQFIAAARAVGLGLRGIVGRHLLPNIAGPIIVMATLGIGQMILLEAGLSYLGVGVRPPTPSWGQIIADGQQVLRTAPWVALFPGLAIVVTVLAFSLLGDGVRRALDPRSR
jgi:peptide/nickel transport system permease protein